MYTATIKLRPEHSATKSITLLAKVLEVLEKNHLMYLVGPVIVNSDIEDIKVRK